MQLWFGHKKLAIQPTNFTFWRLVWTYRYRFWIALIQNLAITQYLFQMAFIEKAKLLEATCTNWGTSHQLRNGSSLEACVPWICPVQGGHTAVQHLQADGDVNQGDKDTTPWDRAVQEQHEQHTDVFRQLLDAQADGNPQDVNRAMPLFTTFQSLGHNGSGAASKHSLPKHHHVISGQIGGTICTLMNLS